jgi:hypothetical protein
MSEEVTGKVCGLDFCREFALRLRLLQTLLIPNVAESKDFFSGLALSQEVRLQGSFRAFFRCDGIGERENTVKFGISQRGFGCPCVQRRERDSSDLPPQTAKP